MANLLRRVQGDHGKVHEITPESANWSYVGFNLYQLNEGETCAEVTGDREVILVLVEGKAEIDAADQSFGELGDRLNVFEKKPPHCVYVPGNSEWQAKATTRCTLAVCSAPYKGEHQVSLIDPNNIQLTERGKDTNTRYINNIAMENDDFADSLLVTEVFTPSGHWSSYPPHRHDVDDYPDLTYLEEIYYHRVNPAQGYGHQRVFTEDGEIDETYSFSDHDVVLVPKGHHPVGAPYGYELYYLNVMAGPMRKWRFRNHPDHAWIYERDNA
jgi:5-deoxy-glucuronate isomerase